VAIGPRGRPVRLYLIYTPSHEEFFRKWFLPSLKDDFELAIERYDQECPSANFVEEGWDRTMLHKVDVILRGIEENWNGVFLHADVDIQFFRPCKALLLEAIRDKDLVAQRDSGSGILCAGFFALRGNDRTLALWHAVRKTLLDTNARNEQDILNHLLRGKYRNWLARFDALVSGLRGRSTVYLSGLRNRFGVTWNYLPKTFFSPGIYDRCWEPGMDFEVPSGIVLHHANWTVGVENKKAQLEYVRRRVQEAAQFNARGRDRPRGRRESSATFGV
jgi:hypothetical protein